MMVVVLILAILAAIGLPQYFKVTEKQKGVEALGILASIANAQERFFLINNSYTMQYRNLDLDLTDFDTRQPPAGTTNVFRTRSFEFALGDSGAIVTAQRRDGSYTFIKTVETSEVICTGDEELCELFPSAPFQHTMQADIPGIIRELP